MKNLPNEIFIILKDIWPMLAIFVITLIAVRICYITEKREKFVLYKEFFSLFFVVYILLLYGILTNTEIQSYGNNYIPFKEILRYDIGSSGFIFNVLGNIGLFTPFGFLMGSYLNSKKVTKPLLLTILVSTSIECIQMFIGRSFDIDDIILNSLGGLLGYFLYVVLTAIKGHMPKFLQKDFIYNSLTVALIIFIILYILKFLGVVTL